jgi:hypothetical protein
LLDERRGELFRTLELGLVVFVGAADRAADSAGAVARLTRSYCRVTASMTGTGVVDADPIPIHSAEQLIDRHAKCLAENVPERNIDRREGACLGANRPNRRAALQIVPAALDQKGILA